MYTNLLSSWCGMNCFWFWVNCWTLLKDKSKSCPNHLTICLLRHSGESLQNGQLELWKLILCPRDPQGYSCISLSLSGRILERVLEHRVGFNMRYSMGFAKLHSLKCSLHKWALCGAARKSARLNCINLIHFRLTAGRLRGSLCIVIPGVVCELLQFAATQ